MAAHRQVLDEGYSGEETRSQSDSDMMYSDNLYAAQQQLLAMALDLPVDARKQLVESIIRSLPNVDKESIGTLCSNLTHFDPVHQLPNELMLSILSYLAPKDLLTTSAVSRAWRERAQDEKLWRSCFVREGWLLDRNKLDAFEERARRKGKKNAEMSVSGSVVRMGSGLERRGSRKRKTEEAFSEGEASGQVHNATSPESMGEGSMAPNLSDASDDGMEGIMTASPGGTVRALNGSTVPGTLMSPADALMSLGDEGSRRSSTDSATSLHSHTAYGQTPADIQLNLTPKLWRSNTTEPKLSWPYLYKQRCKLEKNWEQGRYKMFQLPLPEHSYEGHTECVYTIQHTTKHLVSGSRDRTIRRWDLQTNRLKGEPLRGHEASVLCLQFDERPDHDIIVSGGSDAYVIIWRFSTGEILRRMTNAHEESVLNLRFDDRYIVTCSKDKSIKIWNRRALTRDDPLVSTHILSTLDNHIPSLIDATGLIREHTLLMTLRGHQAAVNAVQIHGDNIISASGDRTIKSWSISHGNLNKTYVGHTKGIACVQFDGRRIVSGSSDNTVRIFDGESTAEIACLGGHGNLVRTVQARFGDLDTVTDEELEDEARATDRAFYQALENGLQVAPASRRPSGRNAGSSRPEDLQAIGAKMPPGGGGSRWAKIVSGSYDETVVIWKRDRDGKWVVKQSLNQDQILKDSPRRRRAPVAAAAAGMPLVNGAGAAQAHVAGGAGPGHVNAVQAGTAAATQTLQAVHANLVQVHHAVQPINNAGTANLLAGAQGTVQAAVQNHLQQQSQGQVAAGNGHAQGNANANLPGLSFANAPSAAAAAHLHVGNNGIHLANAAPNNANNVFAPPAAAHIQPAAHHAAMQAPAQHHRDSNRVFKLQFDARRIICCSQNKVIVGWDFADGDRELERVGGWSVETA